MTQTTMEKLVETYRDGFIVGDYRLRLIGQRDESLDAERDKWVEGDDESIWQRDQWGKDIKSVVALDQGSYGDQGVMLVGKPHEDGQELVAENGGQGEHEWAKAAGGKGHFFLDHIPSGKTVGYKAIMAIAKDPLEVADENGNVKTDTPFNHIYNGSVSDMEMGPEFVTDMQAGGSYDFMWNSIVVNDEHKDTGGRLLSQFAAKFFNALQDEAGVNSGKVLVEAVSDNGLKATIDMYGAAPTRATGCGGVFLEGEMKHLTSLKGRLDHAKETNTMHEFNKQKQDMRRETIRQAAKVLGRTKEQYQETLRKFNISETGTEQERTR